MILVTKLVFICIGTMVSCLVDEAKHKKAYEKLLNSIVNLNEKRIDALKKIHYLEQQNVVTKLRVGREIPTKAHLEDDRPVLLVYLHVSDEKPDLRSKTNKKLSSKNLKRENNEDENKSSIKKGLTALNVKNVPIYNGNVKMSKEEESLLRKSWRGSCDKEAMKKCRTACCNAYKNTCATYKCRSKQKKKFKKGCKRSCKDKFRGDSSSSSSSSDTDSD